MTDDETRTRGYWDAVVESLAVVDAVDVDADEGCQFMVGPDAWTDDFRRCDADVQALLVLESHLLPTPLNILACRDCRAAYERDPVDTRQPQPVAAGAGGGR